MADNESLKFLYENAYRQGRSYAGDPGSFFTFSTAEVTEFIVRSVDFRSKDVLEIGCGTGETAATIAKSGARTVLAIDYSEEAISTCKSRHSDSGVNFRVMSYQAVSGNFDVIVMQEVIEHLDDPETVVCQLSDRLHPSGKLVVTCPNFTNIRGYIWMALQLLLKVPMSLSDLHFLSPFDMEEIARKHKLTIEWTTFAHDRVTGDKLIIDMRKRLTNALCDANLDNSNVEVFMNWLSKVTRFDSTPSRINGGKGFYVFTRG